MFKTVFHILVFLFVSQLGLLSAYALSHVDGSVEMSYGGYKAEENGSTVADVDYFTQKYSLLYSIEGDLMQGRGGSYDLALGGEWISLAIDGLSENPEPVSDIDSGKLLFRGNFLFAPGGLPVRFQAYSRDIKSALFVEDEASKWQGNVFPYQSHPVLESRVYDDIDDGTQIETGATLFIGIRNGHYLGKYRNILSMFPRLLVDYHQSDVRDLKSLAPQKYRERDLAFVSLNKKDNWFHYRRHDYTDYLDSNNDYKEETVMLGTVDHLLTRKWINITNWIQVSADGSYTTLDAIGQQPDEKRFDLNLFSTGTRSNWQFSNFTTYERLVRGDQLLKELEVPVYASGNLNRDTGWRLRLIGEKRDDMSYATPANNFELQNAYVDSRVEAFRTARYRADIDLELEYRDDSFKRGDAQRVTVDFYSNHDYQPRYDLFGSLALSRFGGKQSGTSDSTSYYEMAAIGKVETSLTSRVRVGLQEQFVLGQGDLVTGGETSYIAPLGVIDVSTTNAVQSNTTFRNTLALFAEISTASRWRNRFELASDFFHSDADNDQQVTARHTVNYDGLKFYLRSSEEYIYDSSPTVTYSTSLVNLGGNVGGATQSEFRYGLTTKYSPSRNLELSGMVDYQWSDVVNGPNHTTIDASQTLLRSFYSRTGLIRRLASIEQELRYEEEASGIYNIRVGTLGVAANLYPTRNFYIGSRVRYRYFQQDEQGEYAVYLMAGLDYEKLKVNVDYAYGDREKVDGADLPQRVEHRWRVEVKKTF